MAKIHIERNDNLNRLEGLIARSQATTMFLEIMRLEELVLLATEREINNNFVENATFQLNLRKQEYQAHCQIHNLPPQV